MGSEDARMTGGDGADRFIFQNAFGTARIKDFEKSDGDIIQFVFLNGAGNFDQVMDNARTRNGDTVIDLTNAKVIIEGISKADLEADMFMYV